MMDAQLTLVAELLLAPVAHEALPATVHHAAHAHMVPSLDLGHPSSNTVKRT